MPLLPIAWIEAIFATKAALTPRLCGGAISQEVVLANAIHGLLRSWDGRNCRGGLRVRCVPGFERHRAPRVGRQPGPGKALVGGDNLCREQ